MRFGIRGKLLAAFAATALFTAVLGGYAVNGMSGLNNDSQTMYDDVFGGTYLLAGYVNHSWQARSQVAMYLTAETPAQRASVKAQIGKLDQTLADDAKQLDQADTDRQDVGTLAEATSAWKAYAQWRDETLIKSVDAGNQDAALASFDDQGARLSDAFDQAINDFLDKKHSAADDLNKSGDQTFDETRIVALALAAAAAALAIGLGVLLSKAIGGGVRQITAAAKGLAAGDVEQRIDVRSKDEIGEMAEAFRTMIAYQQEMARVAAAMSKGDLSNDVDPKSERDRLGQAFAEMIRNLRQLVGQVQHSANALADTSRQLDSAAAQTGSAVQQVAQAIQQVASGAQDTSRSAQETDAAVTQLSQAVEGIARGAGE